MGRCGLSVAAPRPGPSPLLVSGTGAIALEVRHDRVQDLRIGPSCVDDHDPLLWQRALERLELTLKQAGGEEVAGPLLKATLEHRGGHVQQEHPDITHGTEPVAMGPPKRAAGEDLWIASLGSGNHAAEPGIPLGVGQGLAPRHLLHSFGRVKLVGVEKGKVEPGSQHLAESRLAGASHPDEDDNHAPLVALAGMETGWR